MEVKKRDAYLDIVKGIAIIAVVVGHCIQFGSGAEFMQGDFFYNDVFRFIYSWHMPLFMLVSGYLFSFSVRRHDWRALIISRFKQLVLPMLSWAILITIVLCTLGGGQRYICP
ncbi:acyltransferase family protein [Selenomonas sp. GACV-9]|uniref:acyltransferase family protein n=1 Tax=Selenomonas sp. GACV-9 TaxID=3158782 RepID=UPI00094CC06C